jgi:uncharacterized membrane protein YqaE (UPF0057 family)
MGSVFFISGVLLYFLPSIIAAKKRNAGAIFVLNLLLGWTLIGWVAALVWAVSAETPIAGQPMLQVLPVCPICRAAVGAGQRFCQSCGTGLAWQAGPPNQLSASNPSQR